MSAEESPRPPRRKRYGGKNPCNFEDKYKERDPARHAETIAKVLASGKTPAGTHVPVMVAECMAALALEPGMRGVDATLGYGGHAAAVLKRISPGGRLLGLDVDPLELPKTLARLRAAGWAEEAFAAARSNYAGISKAVAEWGGGPVDFVFADLGCSSMQYDDPARGFTFKAAGPLDMRMNPARGLAAGDWLERISPEKLEAALAVNADEPRAESLAAALAGRRFADTLALAAAVREAVRIADADELESTVRRVFQAVRIAVNDEFGGLDAFLRALPGCLRPDGRVAILTFHSGEDRRVKLALRTGLRDGIFAETGDRPVVAGPEERRANPRSRAAKLRWAALAGGA